MARGNYRSGGRPCRTCGKALRKDTITYQGHCKDCAATMLPKCIQCDVVKPVKQFTRNGRVCSTCNECGAKAAVKRRKPNKECPGCATTQPMEEFKTGGCYQRLCRSCRAQEVAAKAAKQAAAKQKKASARQKKKEATEPRYINLYPGWAALEFDGIDPFDPQIVGGERLEMAV